MSLLSKLLKEELGDGWNDFQRDFRSKVRDPLLDELVEAVGLKLKAWIPAQWRVPLTRWLGKLIWSALVDEGEEEE